MSLVRKRHTILLNTGIMLLVSIAVAYMLFGKVFVNSEIIRWASFTLLLSGVAYVLFLKRELKKITKTAESFYQHKIYIQFDYLTKDFNFSEGFRKAFAVNIFKGSDLALLQEALGESIVNSFYKALQISQLRSGKYYLQPINFNGHAFLPYALTVSENHKPLITYLVFEDITEIVTNNHSLRADYTQAKSDNKLLQEILDNIPIAVWLRDCDNNIIYTNKCYHDIVSQKTIKNISPQQEIDKFSKDLALEVLQEQSNKRNERYIVINGKRLLYQFHDLYLPSQKRVLSTAYDVASKDALDKDLQRSLAAQSELLEATSNASAIFGANRRLKFYNHAFIKLWDLDETWLDSAPKYELVLDKLRDIQKLPEQANYANFRKQQISLFTSLTETYNDFYYLPDGRSLRVIVIPHSMGGLLFSYEDMTDRIALESSYNTLIDVQKATLDNLHEGICVFGENGRLKLSNPTFAMIWKLKTDFLKTKPHISDLLEASGHLFYDQELLQKHKRNFLAVADKRTSMYEKIERTDGSVISRLIVPLPDGATMVSDLDMTDSVVVERSLREKNIALKNADKIKTEFLANVSYELRSPLTSIMGIGELLTKQYFGALNDKQQEYVADIYASAKYLMNIINDIIDVTSIDAGYIELRVAEFDINSAIDAVLQLVKEKLHTMNLACNYQSSPIPVYILGDEKRIKQVIFKLLSKMIDLSLPNAQIDVSLEKIEGFVYLTLEEDSNTAELIYNNLALRKEEYKKTETGLGLSIIRTFIELHGGDVIIERQDIGRTKIICKLPCKNPDLLSIYHSYEQENSTAKV